MRTRALTAALVLAASLPAAAAPPGERLVWAIQERDYAGALALLSAGADPGPASIELHVRGPDGALRPETRRFVPLLNLLRRANGSPGEMELLEALLAAGADPNVVGDAGTSIDVHPVTQIRSSTPLLETPLSVALSPESKPADRVRVVELLLRRGARPTVPEARVPSPIEYVAINRPRVDEETRWRLWSALAGAKADLDRIDARGSSALATLVFYAGAITLNLREGNVRMALDALRRGARTDTRDWRGQSPLHLAVSAGLPEMVRALLEAGAAVAARDEKGATPLHAVPPVETPGGPQRQIFELLAAGGADLNARDAAGRTPLAAFAANCFAETAVEWLLSRGADPEVADAEGVTALGAARSWACRKNVVALEKRGLKRSFAWTWPVGNRAAAAVAVATRDRAALERLPAEAFAERVARTSEGAAATPLHLAAELGDLEVIEALGRRKVDWTVRDVYGRTPLHVAALLADPRPALALLRLGADPNAEDLAGKSPLALAAARRPSTARALLDAGARPTTDGPLEVAMATGDLELVRRLADLRPPRPAHFGLAVSLGSQPLVSLLAERLDPSKDVPLPPDPQEPWVRREHANPVKGTLAEVLARARATAEEQDRFRKEADAFAPAPHVPGPFAARRGEFLLPLERWSTWMAGPDGEEPKGFPLAAYVPQGCDGKEPCGLMVFMWGRRSTPGYPSSEYRKRLDRERLIWLAFSAYDVGLDSPRPRWSHALVALAAVEAAERAFRIDPRRVFLGGLSWGGRQTSAIVCAWPQLFRGGVAMGGAYTLALGSRWPVARERVRLVLSAGDADYNRDESYQAWGNLVGYGYAHLQLILDPARLHELLSPEGFDRALAHLRE
jgi:ankyrin repeat protein